MNEVIEILKEFEQSFDPMDLGKSTVKSQLVGYGEISAIFSIDSVDGRVFKRMPLFDTFAQAFVYQNNYYEYCRLLTEAGLNLPPSECYILSKNDRLFVLFIGQKKYPIETFCHRRIHEQSLEETRSMLEALIDRIETIWVYNTKNQSKFKLAIDGQLSNWVWCDEHGERRLIYIDTSTPIYKKAGREIMDPELILKSAPGPLKAIIKFFFLEDVMDRYYKRREVYIDLAANLYKEQRPDLIPLFLEVINQYMEEGDFIHRKEIDKYYREDKLIWSFFLTARRIDRWVKRKILGKPYEFILPGKIKR